MIMPGYERKHLGLPGCRMSYLTNTAENTGKSPLIVLLHPSGTDATIMRKQLELLGNDGIYAIAPDLRGSGQSIPQISGLERVLEYNSQDEKEIVERVLSIFSIQNYAHDVQAVIDAEAREEQQTVVIGVSLGGYVALQLGYENPNIKVVAYGVDWTDFDDAKREAWLSAGISGYMDLTDESIDARYRAFDFISKRWGYWDNAYTHGNYLPDTEAISPQERIMHYAQIHRAIKINPQLAGLAHLGVHVAIAYYEGEAEFLNSDIFRDSGLPHIPLNGNIGYQFYNLVKEKAYL